MSRTVNMDERQVLAVKLDLEGLTTVEVADRIGVCPRTVYRWRDLPDYQSLLTSLKDDMHRAARATLNASARVAASEIVRLMSESTDDRIRLSAAQTLLDRTGHPKAERIEMDADVRAKVDVASPIESLDSMMTGGGGEQ